MNSCDPARASLKYVRSARSVICDDGKYEYDACPAPPVPSSKFPPETSRPLPTSRPPVRVAFWWMVIVGPEPAHPSNVLASAPPLLLYDASNVVVTLLPQRDRKSVV